MLTRFFLFWWADEKVPLKTVCVNRRIHVLLDAFPLHIRKAGAEGPGVFRVSLSQYNRLLVVCTFGRPRLRVSAIYLMYNRHSLLELPFDMLVDL